MVTAGNCKPSIEATTRELAQHAKTIHCYGICRILPYASVKVGIKKN